MKELAGKLLLTGAVLAVGVLLARRALAGTQSLAGQAGEVLSNAVWSLSPTNPDNLAARTVNAGVSAATGREETLGGFLHDLINPDPVTSWKPPPPPQNGAFVGEGVLSGIDAWDRAYGYPAEGGASFGIYPRGAAPRNTGGASGSW